MTALTVVDGVGLARLVAVYRDLLRAHQEELNRLNVYPVPDGDTGTNMALTLEAVCAELGDDSSDMDGVCRAVAHGSLMGARGNSGVILSQVLRGLTDTFAKSGAVGPRELAEGLEAASDAAYRAVMHPVEGTILTVVREAAEAARAAAGGGADLVAVLEAVDTEAHASVARTPDLLAVLAQAGVVDAGGRGLALLFDAWLHVVADRALPEPHVVAVGAGAGVAPSGPTAGAGGGAGPAGPRYEVMFFLHAPDGSIDGFRDAWDGLGDSIVVVGGDGVWNCHVHTDDIGAAVEAGIAVGRPAEIHVTDLHEQVGRREADWVAGAVAEPASTAVVAVASGPGVTALLHSLGVGVVVPGGQSMNPSTAQILEAVERSGADSVVVLPNNKNIVAVAEQAVGLAHRPVEVVATHSVVEALAAMLSFDADGTAGDNAPEMRDAAARVRTGEVTQAVRDGVGECGPITTGDWIAITREGICATAPSAVDAAIAVLDRLVVDSDELVTLLVGADADEADTARLRDHLADAHPQVELEVHHGGQPLYPYLVGVE